MQFKTMGRDEAIKIREIISGNLHRLEADLAAAGLDGFKLEAGMITYGGDTFNLKIKGGRTNPDTGVVACEESENWQIYHHRYGLPADAVGKTFQNSSGQTFTLIGCRPRSHKYPILCRREDGRLVKFQASAVRRMMVASGTLTEEVSA